MSVAKIYVSKFYFYGNRIIGSIPIGSFNDMKKTKTKSYRNGCSPKRSNYTLSVERTFYRVGLVMWLSRTTTIVKVVRSDPRLDKSF